MCNKLLRAKRERLGRQWCFTPWWCQNGELADPEHIFEAEFMICEYAICLGLVAGKLLTLGLSVEIWPILDILTMPYEHTEV